MTQRLSGYERKQIAERIKSDIATFCSAHYDNERRSHLGASEIGKVCDRRLVYSFRWMYRKIFDGRMLRLFNRGHREEERIIEWLRGITAKVWATTEDGKQFRISSDGHFGGSMDGLAQLSYGFDMMFLTEYKTHNDKSFQKLVKANSVKLAKPEHYVQMCVYGEDYDLHYAIYFAVNKNDDDIYVEIVELDHELGKRYKQRGKNIVYAERLPPKIAATAAFMDCKYCDFVGICQNGQSIDKNCRSCAASIPLEGGEWFCRHWNANIPREEIPKGCGNWTEFK